MPTRLAPILLVIVCVVTATPAGAIPNRPDRGPSPELRKPWRALTGARVVIRGDAPIRWRGRDSIARRLPRRDKRRVRHGPVRGVVVFDVFDDVQVRVDASPLRGLVWIERGDLLTVVTRDVPLAIAGTRGLTVRAGAPVEVIERAGARARVRLVSHDIEVTGEVDASALGTSYQPPDRSQDGARPGLADPILPPGVVVRSDTRADAPALATARGLVFVRHVGKPRDGWQEIELGSDLAGRGFIPATGSPAPRLMPPPPPPPPPGRPVSTSTLDAGTCLYDRPDGFVVAVTDSESSFRDRAGPKKGWRWIAVSLIGDDVELAVRPDDATRCLSATEMAAE